MLFSSDIISYMYLIYFHETLTHVIGQAVSCPSLFAIERGKLSSYLIV